MQHTVSISKLDHSGRDNPTDILKHYISYGYTIVYEGVTGYTLEYNKEPTSVHINIVRKLLGCESKLNMVIKGIIA